MTTRFSTISRVVPGRADTWAGKSFITLDIDWACDEVLAYSIDLLEAAEVPATWFVTHDTPLLERLRGNPDFELGIHPNFNFLLEGDDRKGRNAEEVVERVLDIVPEATSVRSHSMTQSSRILDLFAQCGLTHDVNHFLPLDRLSCSLQPWDIWNGMVKVPYGWEDDLHFIRGLAWDVAPYLDAGSINVFDFHPIHLYLNTENQSRYEGSRHCHRDSDALETFRNHNQPGTYSFLKQLLGLKQR